MVTELEKRMAEAILKNHGGDRLTALATVMDLKDIIDKCMGSNDWDEGYLPDIDGDCECLPHVHHFTRPGGRVPAPEIPDVHEPSVGFSPISGIRWHHDNKGIKSNWNIHDGGRIIVGNEPKKPPEKLGSPPNSKMIGSQNGDIELISYFPWTFFAEICNGVRLDIFEGVIHPDGSGTIGLRKSSGKDLLSGDFFFDQKTGYPRYFSIHSGPRISKLAEDLICTGLHYDPRKSSCVQVSFIKANP